MGSHYYSFTPPEDGDYELVHSGAGTVQYCLEPAQAGCICGVDINCCSGCTLSFVEFEGPLKAGTPYQFDVFEDMGSPGTYSIRVDGPV